MKTKIFCHWMYMLLMCMAAAPNSSGQQPTNRTLVQNNDGHTGGNYSFRLFLAPNQSFGYDIFKNEKIIFHQPAFSKPTISRDEMLVKKEQANSAAMLAIEKIKKAADPTLSGAELRKITGNNNR